MTPTLDFWGTLFVRLFFEASMVAALAAIGQCWTTGAAWRRLMGCGALLCLAVLLVAEISGMGEWTAHARFWNKLQIGDEKRFVTAPIQKSRAELLTAPAAVAAAPRTLASSERSHYDRPQSMKTNDRWDWWPGALWGVGCLFLLARKTLCRIKFQRWVRRGTDSQESECQAMVQRLAAQMRLGKTVRVVQLPGLKGPVAFGLWHPIIGIPQGFGRQFAPAQQEAMLAHELAHLKNGDIAWQLIADGVLAAWWWHPLVWRAHRQWLESCEMAADEASAMIEHGTGALAEGLVILGRQLSDAALPPGMSAQGNGFRSLLGRRVHHLLHLKHPIPTRTAWTNPVMTAYFALLLGAAWGAASLGAPALRGGEWAGSSNWRQSWRRSMVGMAMAAALPQTKPMPIPQVDKKSAAVPDPKRLVWIQPGTFTMGSPTNEAGRRDTEGPQTQVTISHGFWMSKHEMTQGEFQAVMGYNPSKFQGDTNRPVEQVSWKDATNYCFKLTLRERIARRMPAGYAYRLPTEAEWEYACRAGTTTAMAYGNSLSSIQENFQGGYPYGGAATGPNLMRTTAVGSYAPNAWGLCDMHGNVGEWCLDWFSASLPGGSVTDPRGPKEGSCRVIRGGAWNHSGATCRSAIRFSYAEFNFMERYGFRIVLALR